MFGLLYFLFLMSAFVACGVNKNHNNNKIMKRTRTSYGTYNTADGKIVDAASGKYVRWYRDNNWDFILTNCLDVNRNVSEEKRNQVFLKRQKDHPPKMTVMEWNIRDEHKNDSIKGVRCRDLKTGRFFVARTVDRGFCRTIDFYVDALTGEFIRRTDFQMELDDWGPDSDLVKQIIKTNGKGYDIKICNTVASPYETTEMKKEWRELK